MTFVPAHASAAGVLPDPSPIVGSVAAINHAGDYAQRVVDRAFDYRSSVQGAQRSLMNASADAVAVLLDKLDTRLMLGVNALSDSATSAKSGFDRYASDVESIHHETRGIIESIDDHLSVIRTHAGTISEIAREIGAITPANWASVPDGAMPEPRLGRQWQGLDSAEQENQKQVLSYSHSSRWYSAALGWKSAYDSIKSHESRLKALVTERRDAESRLLATLRSTDLGQLIAAGHSGSHSPREMVAFGLSGELRGGSLLDGNANPAVEELLGRTDLFGPELTKAWNELGLTPEEIAALPMATLAQLANRNGLPAWVQDIASTELMHYALAVPSEAYALFGFNGAGPDIAEFRSQIGKLYDAWENAKREALRMGGEPVVQLLALGSHDGALTAAISHGDLDTASHVGVNTSGMFSSVDGIGNDAKGARSLYNEAYRADRSQSYASVTWIGYHSPDLLEVNGMARAEAGGPRLAAFIDGIYDSREANAQPIGNFTVFAHSYGSTTAAVALMETRHHVDSLVTYGSAGLSHDTPIGALHTEQVFATQAGGDQMATWGRLVEHPVNPVKELGVQVFSSEGDDKHWRVTAHDMFTEDDSPSAMNWGGKVGYLTSGTGSAADMGKIWANGGLTSVS